MSIVRHIPNTITSLNLLCGVAGVISTMSGRPDTGFLFMLGAAVCDFCDGLAARLLKVRSDIGKELDSLCDVVSFGVLPALMLFTLFAPDGNLFSGRNLLSVLSGLVSLLPAVFSALRLAKFNLDERQHDGFIGLPTPAAAMLCGSLAYHVFKTPSSFLASWCAGPVFIPVLSLCLCALLVCEVPMFSMKIGGGKQPDFRTSAQRTAFLSISAIAAIVVAVLGLDGSLVVLLSFTAYILINLAFALVPSGKRHVEGL